MSTVIKKQFITVLTCTMILAGGIVGILFYFFVPALYFQWYPILPIAYFSIGMSMIYMLDRNKNADSPKNISIYMVLRGIKILCTILIAMLYTLLINEKQTIFIVTLFIYYFTYLGLETWILYRYEKEITNLKKKL